MAVTYAQLERQVHNLLGNIKGKDIAEVETAYAAVSSATNRNNPDFAFTPVQDAIVNTISEIVEAIASTPRHPERGSFLSTAIGLVNGQRLPSQNAGGIPFVGIPGGVFDGTTGARLETCPVDQILDYNRFPGIYAGSDVFWYAYQAEVIVHTRTMVTIEWCVWQRPTFASAGNIALRDYHEQAVVNGATSFIAQKEGNYSDLVAKCRQLYDDHVAEIMRYGSPTLATTQHSAPATA